MSTRGHVIHFVEKIANLIDFLVIGLLVTGLVVSISLAARTFFSSEGNWAERLSGPVLIKFRITLGRWLLAGLEALIVSDILHSIIHRTLSEVGIVAAVVAIRTALAYFLDHEIARVEQRSVTSPQNAVPDKSGNPK
ncbi:DUF1622 domain-containing protein [uncultured Roseibium sp.]|uniref:DUF1622 domain-containing protein n=1 Tax=uncultured Roseibium sp. TaxID=1936171 RepID=UPI003217446B